MIDNIADDALKSLYGIGLFLKSVRDIFVDYFTGEIYSLDRQLDFPLRKVMIERSLRRSAFGDDFVDARGAVSPLSEKFWLRRQNFIPLIYLCASPLL
jgi:hypothetical protein